MHTVLLISASPMPAELEALHRNGYAASSACGAEQALERLQREPPDVVLVDLDAPIADARAFLAAWLSGWRQGLRWANVPVAALSRRDASILSAVAGAVRPGPLLGFAA